MQIWQGCTQVPYFIDQRKYKADPNSNQTFFQVFRFISNQIASTLYTMKKGIQPQWWVAGLGGVGGYIGAKLCEWATKEGKIAIHFLARGLHQKAILENGLELQDQGHVSIVRPNSCVETVAPDSTCASFLFICCKSYDLNALLEQIAPLVDRSTLLLPLLNGVSAVEIVQERFPEALVIDGGVFMVSSIHAPGVIHNKGPKQQIFMGRRDGDNAVLEVPLQFLAAAGLDVVVHHPIQQLTWEKFLLIAPLATLTTAHNVSARTVGQDPKLLAEFESLFFEMLELSSHHGLLFSPDIWQVTLQKVLNTPDGATTSMHRDFLSKSGRCEVAFLTEHPVYLGKKIGLAMKSMEHYLHVLNAMGAHPLKY